MLDMTINKHGYCRLKVMSCLQNSYTTLLNPDSNIDLRINMKSPVLIQATCQTVSLDTWLRLADEKTQCSVFMNPSWDPDNLELMGFTIPYGTYRVQWAAKGLPSTMPYARQNKRSKAPLAFIHSAKLTLDQLKTKWWVGGSFNSITFLSY